MTRSKRARSVFGGVTDAAALQFADAFESRLLERDSNEEEEERRAPRAGGSVPVRLRLAAYGDASADQARRRVDRSASIARAVR